MSARPSGSEMPRPFLPTRDLSLSKRLYLALGGALLLDSDVAIFRLGRGEFLLQARYVKEWAENAMMQLMVDDLDQWGAAIEALDLPGRLGVAPPKAPAMQPRGLRVAHVIDPAESSGTSRNGGRTRVMTEHRCRDAWRDRQRRAGCCPRPRPPALLARSRACSSSSAAHRADLTARCAPPPPPAGSPSAAPSSPPRRDRAAPTR